MQKRGLAIVNVLFFTVALFGLLLLSSAIWMFQMQLSGGAAAHEGARRLAEAAVQVATGRLIKDPTATGATLPSLNVTLPAYQDGQGLLALDGTAAGQLGIPASINNLKGATAIPSHDGVAVLAETARLIGIGRYRGREARVEVILNVPGFPYGVASSVPLKAVDGLQVFAISSPDALSAGFSNIPAEQKRPAHLVTNAVDPSASQGALDLQGASTFVEGDAQARGTVTVGTGAVVSGEVRPNAQPAPLPNLDVTTLDTRTQPGVSDLTSPALNAPRLSGFNRRAGDLNVTGGLNLDGGVLYVDGAVNISGGVSGKGALLATGPVTVNGGGVLTGDNQAAIVSNGTVSIQGSPGLQSEFRGMIYSGGDLHVKYANVAGAVVVNNPQASGRADLEQVNLVESPQLAQLQLSVASSAAGPVPPGLQPMPFFALRTYGIYDRWRFNMTPQMQTMADGSGPYPVTFSMNVKWPGEDYNQPPPGFVVTHPRTAAEPWLEIGPPSPMPADPISLVSVVLLNRDPNGVCNSVDDDGDGWQARYDGFNSRASAEAAILQTASQWPNTCADLSVATHDYLNEVESRVNSDIGNYCQLWNTNSKYLAQHPVPNPNGGPPITSFTRTEWTLDLSKFCSLSERIRILSWRELP